MWRIELKQAKNFQVPPVYGLDATDVTDWNEKVRDVAFRIVDSFSSADNSQPTADEITNKEPKPLAVAETSSREEQTSFHCPVCDKVTVGQRQWQEHVRSNRHRKLVKRAADGVDDGHFKSRRHKGRLETDGRNSGAEAALTSEQQLPLQVETGNPLKE